MYDSALTVSILAQIAEALERIKTRMLPVTSSDYFTNTPEGMEKLDSICMLYIAIGESLKNLDKITNHQLLNRYEAIDWTGVKGFRDIIAHHYFDVDAEQVYWICTHNLDPLLLTIQKMILDLNTASIE